VVTKRYSLIDGVYKISLCKSDNVDYISELYEKENNISMAVDSQMIDKKFMKMKVKAGIETEFEIIADKEGK